MNALEMLRLRRHFVSHQIDIVKQRMNAKQPPFKSGDKVTAWSKHTMGGTGVRTVMDCQSMKGFQSGYGVLTLCSKKPLWLCAGLFKKCAPVHGHLTAERPNTLF